MRFRRRTIMAIMATPITTMTIAVAAAMRMATTTPSYGLLR